MVSVFKGLIIMNAILLAAGLGTRLKPLTNKIPKCLVPINGKPLLEIWLENIFSSGINKCLINTHYLSSLVEEFIYNSNFKNRIEIVNEKHLIGTAGSLKKNINFFNEKNGLVIYADNFTTLSLKDFLQKSKKMPEECYISMLTFECEDSSQAGIVYLNEDNILTNFVEKPKHSEVKLANAGVFMITPKFIKYIKNMQKPIFDISKDIIPFLKSKIFCVKTNELFYDIGTIKNYNLVNSLFNKK